MPLLDPPRALGPVHSFLISILHLSNGVPNPALPGFLAGETEELKSARMPLRVSTLVRRKFGNIKLVNINFSFLIIDSDLNLFSHHPERSHTKICNQEDRAEL